MASILPILVTKQEYYMIGWMMFNFGMFYTANQIFKAPHEREEDESQD